MIRDANVAHAVHYVFEWASLATGAGVYRRIKRRKGTQSLTQGPTFAILLGCLMGAAVGNKAMYWVENPHLWAAASHTPALWLQGQSIVGGLLGAWLGIELAKWWVHWHGPRTGDDFVPAVLVGIAIGRIGCFLAGLHDGTYGLPTAMPWGVDLGDGIARHPAPLYECLAAVFALAAWPRWRESYAHTPGLAFRVFMLGYLAWRLMIDSLKPVPYAYLFGWSGIQWTCAIASLFIFVSLWIDQQRRM
jgi:phosphatidylglycerol:prolipoprotein diacylglycerol transferase